MSDESVDVKVQVGTQPVMNACQTCSRRQRSRPAFSRSCRSFHSLEAPCRTPGPAAGARIAGGRRSRRSNF